MCVAVVDYKTSLVTRRSGVCTKWMAGWKLGGIFLGFYLFIVDCVEFGIQKGTMDCVDTDTPVILIGPGKILRLMIN